MGRVRLVRVTTEPPLDDLYGTSAERDRPDGQRDNGSEGDEAEGEIDAAPELPAEGSHAPIVQGVTNGR